MGNDVSSNGFFGICSKHGCSIHLGYYLVGDYHRYTKLMRERMSVLWPQTYQNINAHNTAMANYRSSLIIQGTNVLRRLQQFVTTESPWILGFFTTAYLISKSQQHPQKSGQMHLPGWKLSATRVVCSVEGSSTVYNEQCVPTRKKNSLSKSPPFPTTLSFYVFHIFHFSSFGDWGLLLICSPGCSEIYDPRVSVSQLPG